MTVVDAATVRSDARQWRGLLVTGAWCAFASVVMVVVQIGIYVVWPPPESTAGFFELLLDNPVHGLVSLDLLYIVSNALMYLVYLALAVVLWRVSRGRRDRARVLRRRDSRLHEHPAPGRDAHSRSRVRRRRRPDPHRLAGHR
jgi:hypothetical protein